MSARRASSAGSASSALATLRRRALGAGVAAASVLPGGFGARARYLRLTRRMDRGEVPSVWRGEMLAQLRRADALLARGDDDGAVEWFDKALRVGYHASLHYGLEDSPLIADPEGFLAPVRASDVGRLLLAPPTRDDGPSRPAPRQRADSAGAGAGASDAPVRLLVIAQRNWTFVNPVIDALEQNGFEVRRFEVDDLPPSERPTRERVLRARMELARTGRRLPTPAVLAAEFDWADVVLVEWGHHVLTWVSLLAEMPRVTAARIHRFEAYTPFPLLTVFDVVDRVLFVSPHVRTLIQHLTANLERAGEIIGVDNFLAYGLGPEPRGDRDTHLLAQVGWLRPVKDVLFTLDLLERVRAEDPRHRLQLIGPGLPEDPAQDTAFQARVRRRLAEFPTGAVQVLGARSDVPDLLAMAGWIVSSSLHEGVHEAVMEGIAAGCVPLIRNWPDARPYGGAGVIYPDRWVVEDLDGAVDRVLRIEREHALAEVSAEARAWVVERRTASTVTRGYIEALSPQEPPAGEDPTGSTPR
ncbi:glycosyltransferase [Brachybacterium halotolerans subsp. kimchii]|uniref:glycosyltransferase n=1 Tax=Brachybacterium halotolerans TaxID=2795215 RepID=UPI001E3C9A95|nr:glycosyltransferase [Brachybacterium halotolerans]UEJ82560.1 glycosyltransferase [Brachybacterium halotolerans subsp. kimchii]